MFLITLTHFLARARKRVKDERERERAHIQIVVFNFSLSLSLATLGKDIADCGCGFDDEVEQESGREGEL